MKNIGGKLPRISELKEESKPMKDITNAKKSASQLAGCESNKMAKILSAGIKKTKFNLCYLLNNVIKELS